jgi:RNA polymerase sigma-70 factor (ECF subfamily)
MVEPTSPPDRDLMLRVAHGDAGALDALFRRWAGEAHALCARLTGADDAEDLLQEGFLRVLRYAGTYRGDAFRPWLFRILRNVCLDHVERTGRDRRAGERWNAERPRATMPPGEDDRSDRLRRALITLPLEDRELIVLARYHDLPCERIAEVLDCTSGAARVRLHRAIAKLRAIYERLEREEHELPNRT